MPRKPRAAAESGAALGAAGPAAPAAVFRPGDLGRALDELALVFEDEEWPPGEARFRRNNLIERLRERDVTRACAEALIDGLIARGVFRAGETFLDLHIVVRFDGRQSDTVRPDGFLHTSRERWYRFLVEHRAGQAAQAPSTSRVAGGEATDAPGVAGDGRRFIPTELQERVLEALDGKAMTADALAEKLHVDRRLLFRDAIKELKARGLIGNHRRVGGYYRPDAPPPKYAGLLGQ